MQYQKSLILSLSIMVLLSGLMGQERKVVKIKAGSHDKIKKHIIIEQGEGLSDSSMKQIFIKKMPRHEQKARIVIKKSGFFRKNKIVIDFDPHSREILAVSDNDKEVSASKFHKYQDYLEDAGDMEEMEALHEKMEELEWVIEARDMDDSIKIVNLDIMLDDLETMESDLAKMKKEQYIVQKRIIEWDELSELIQNALEEAGMTPPQKIKDIKVKDGKFFLNGEEISGEAGKKSIAIWEAQQSDLAKMKQQQHIIQKRIIKLDELPALIQNVLEESGMKPPKKIKDIKINDGKFFLNGEEITGEVGKKCITLWETHAGHEAGALHDERMSIHIKFD